MAFPITNDDHITDVHPKFHNARVDVMAHFSAAGDGVTDDTAEIQEAIDATPSYGTCFIPATTGGYKITDTLVVDRSITLLSDGAKITQTGTNKKGLSIIASGVTVDGLFLYGRQAAAAASHEHAIHVDGVDINGYLTNVYVRNCRIENWGFYGINLEFVKHFEVSGCNIFDVVYAGVSTLSCHFGRIVNNDIDLDGAVGSGGDCYGIAVSHNTPANEADIVNQPLSTDIVVSGNLVQNNTLWEGIDTHGGERLLFSNNEVHNCKVGIAVVPSDDISGTVYWAPKDVVVVGNTVDSGVSDGTRQYGIVVVGAGSGLNVYEQLARVTVVGNVVRNHGTAANAISGGIVAYFTEGLVVSGNVLYRCSPSGVLMYHTNFGFSVIGNTMIDPWADTALGASYGVRVASSYQSGEIEGNSFIRADLTGHDYITARGMDVVSGAGVEVQIGHNYSQATLDLVNPGNAMPAVFYNGITIRTRAGAPADTDFGGTDNNAADGTMILDTTNHRLYVRSGGVWKYSGLT